MGASQSATASAAKEGQLVDLPPPSQDTALSLPSPGDDEPLLDLSNVDVKKMKKRACSVDPKLAANPRRKAPPINPKTCKEGSVAMGKDGEFYVIKSGKWMKVSKRIEERKREQLKTKLSDVSGRTEAARKRVAARRAATPKRRGPGRPKGSKKSSKSSPKVPAYTKPKSMSPKKRGPGRPKGSGKKKSAATPKRRGPGRPKGSGKKKPAATPKRGRGRPKGSKNKVKK